MGTMAEIKKKTESERKIILCDLEPATDQSLQRSGNKLLQSCVLRRISGKSGGQ